VVSVSTPITSADRISPQASSSAAGLSTRVYLVLVTVPLGLSVALNLNVGLLARPYLRKLVGNYII
jgi:hypothetical protein